MNKLSQFHFLTVSEWKSWKYIRVQRYLLQTSCIRTQKASKKRAHVLFHSRQAWVNNHLSLKNQKKTCEIKKSKLWNQIMEIANTKCARILILLTTLGVVQVNSYEDCSSQGIVHTVVKFCTSNHFLISSQIAFWQLNFNTCYLFWRNEFHLTYQISIALWCLNLKQIF